MRFDVFIGKAQNLWAENRLLKLHCILNSLALFGLGVMVYAAVHYKTVVIVPPNLQEQVEIAKGVPSQKYIETAVRDIAYLAFNYSPATARGQFGALLTYYAPEDFPEASSFWESQADRAETNKIGSTFVPVRVEMDEARRKIHFSGDQVLYAMDQILERKQKTFTLYYEIRRGRFSVVSIEEGRR